MNESKAVIGFAVWGVAGLALAIGSTFCGPIDPILPSLCLGLLVGYICYKYMGQDKQASSADGNLFGWKISLKGTFVIIGVGTTLLWVALTTGRECIASLTFKAGSETGRIADKSRLTAEALSPSRRLVGYVEGSSLNDAVGKLIGTDYFHPVLSELRKSLGCYMKAKCAQTAGFSIAATSADHVKSGTLEICDDTVLGSKEALELIEMITSREVSTLTLRSHSANQGRVSKTMKLTTNNDSGNSGACYPPDFLHGYIEDAKQQIRIYGLISKQDLDYFSRNANEAKVVLKASSLRGGEKMNKN